MKLTLGFSYGSIAFNVGLSRVFPFESDLSLSLSIYIYIGNRTGRDGLGRVNNGLGLNWPNFLGLKIGLKILVAQLVLKTGLIGPNNLLKAKKIKADQTGSGHIGSGHIRSGQIWPGFFGPII